MASIAIIALERCPPCWPLPMLNRRGDARLCPMQLPKEAVGRTVTAVELSGHSEERSAGMESGNAFDPTLDYYAILGVPVTATAEEIRRAYRHVIRHCHPDRVRDPGRRHVAEERAKLVNAAYAVLSDPDLRRRYDEMRRQRAMADLLFQRYTGPQPAWARPAAGPRSPRPSTNDLAAFVQLLAVTAIFVAVLVLLLVASSAVNTLAGIAP